MKILHLMPHLGGGVGKAHSALRHAASGGIEHHYLLLEEPRDRRFVEQIEALGSTVDVCLDRSSIEAHVAAADIVQIEWWNHPLLYRLLSKPLPEARYVFWVHISGLNAPYYPPGLIERSSRFVYTSSCSLDWDGLSGLPAQVRDRLAVIGSGFGFDPLSLSSTYQKSQVTYLGTVDFVKMHPELFAIIDGCPEDCHVTLYGAFDAEGEPVRAWRAMRHPERVTFAGQIADPRAVLEQTAIFLYPLRPDHYGTAENALIEAMSVGAVPLVMANPAEMAIVRHGVNGVVAADPADAAAKLADLLRHREQLAPMSMAAMQDAASLYTPTRSARLFQDLYRDVMTTPKIAPDFASVIGSEPLQWFLSTQFPDGRATGDLRLSRTGSSSKGSLDHFLAVFPDDEGLLSLRPTTQPGAYP
ncbi:glycosyltransferase [Rhizobium sp. RU36D]|uniref:glycosyltransferase n=1 Tax=Rhizobium sp. RU36D TaxID=1907415 RepID=UPI0009D90FF0|nr:glycosyltransferase [Rhizobium sp. RU36D]SMC94074.1 Glycosyltransferase involved in cell wall bisynthesis [Rhizobium sp. RU36D]